jgi:hypothetical protein
MVVRFLYDDDDDNDSVHLLLSFLSSIQYLLYFYLSMIHAYTILLICPVFNYDGIMLTNNQCSFFACRNNNTILLLS